MSPSEIADHTRSSRDLAASRSILAAPPVMSLMRLATSDLAHASAGGPALRCALNTVSISAATPPMAIDAANDAVVVAAPTNSTPATSSSHSPEYVSGYHKMLRAGITTKPQVAAVYASLYLDRPHVAIEIAVRRKRSAEQLSQARERMIEELQQIGLSNIEDVIEWKNNAVTLKASSSLTVQNKAAIAEISETRGSRGRTLRVKMHPKIDAIAQFLKQITPSGHERVSGANAGSAGATIIIEGGPTGLEVSVEAAPAKPQRCSERD